MKKALDILVKVETIAAIVILIILVAITFSGVFARYIFSRPFTWEEEAQLACMVWITFLAAPIAFHTKSHVAIEILVETFPEKAQKIVDILIMVVMYIILIYFFLRSIDFISVIIRTGRSTPILRIPYGIIYGIAPVSVVLMLISYTYVTIEDLKKPIENKKGDKS